MNSLSQIPQWVQVALAVAAAVGYVLRHFDPFHLHAAKPKSRPAGATAAPAPTTAGTPAPAGVPGTVATLAVVKPPLQVTTAPGTGAGVIGVVTLTEPPHQVQVVPPA